MTTRVRVRSTRPSRRHAKGPIPINRLFVITPHGASAGPSEIVLDTLPLPQKGPRAKEDGEFVIDAEGNWVGNG